MDSFFLNNSLFVDEKVTIMRNEYKIYDSQGVQIGVCKEKRSIASMALSMLASKDVMPFRLELSDARGNVIATLSKGVTLFMSTLKMHDARGVHISTVKQKFGLTPRFEIMGVNGNKLGEIKGDFLAWDFVIYDGNGNNIGAINKKMGSLVREMFTTADKYNVFVSPDLNDEVLRQTILTIASGLDMIFKENNK